MSLSERKRESVSSAMAFEGMMFVGVVVMLVLVFFCCRDLCGQYCSKKDEEPAGDAAVDPPVARIRTRPAAKPPSSSHRVSIVNYAVVRP